MKKLLTLVLISILFAGVANAQDLATLTENYNAAAASLSEGNKEAALSSFISVYDAAIALGDEGAEIAENSKNVIPGICLSISKDLIKESNFDAALTKLDETVELAKKYDNAENEAEALELIPQILLKKANAHLNKKEYAAAIEAYNKIEPKDGVVYLRLGMAHNGAGDVEAAKVAFEAAAADGQASQANKQLSNIYVKEASAALKAKKYEEAIAAAVKSNSYLESKNGYQLAGQAAQNANKIDEAIKYYVKLIELYPNDKSVGQFAFTVGALYQNSKNNEKAKEYYSKAVNDPKFGEQAKKQLEALK